MADHPFADRFEIAREIELGHRFAVAAVRPQRLVGLRNHDAHDLGASCLSARPRPCRDRAADLAAARVTGCATSTFAGFSALISRAGLSCAQALERGLADIAVAGPACEFDLGDEFGLQPMHVPGLARRGLAAERIGVRGRGLQGRHDALHRILPETGADDADIGEMIVAIDAGHQRAEFALGGFPAAEHDLLAGANLGLGPGRRAAGMIGRIELLRDDAFERQLARRLQHLLAIALEMLDIADLFRPCPSWLQESASAALSARAAADGAGPAHRRTTDRRRRRRDHRSCRPRSPPAASRSQARRHDRVRRSRRRSTGPGVRRPPWRWPRT